MPTKVSIVTSSAAFRSVSKRSFISSFFSFLLLLFVSNWFRHEWQFWYDLFVMFLVKWLTHDIIIIEFSFFLISSSRKFQTKNVRFSWPSRRCRCTPGTPTGAKRSRTNASSVSSRFRPTTSWCSTSASTRAKNLIVALIAIAVSSSSVTSSNTLAFIQVSSLSYSFLLSYPIIFFKSYDCVSVSVCGPRPSNMYRYISRWKDIRGSWEHRPNVRNSNSTILVSPPSIDFQNSILFFEKKRTVRLSCY